MNYTDHHALNFAFLLLSSPLSPAMLNRCTRSSRWIILSVLLPFVHPPAHAFCCLNSYVYLLPSEKQVGTVYQQTYQKE